MRYCVQGTVTRNSRRGIVTVQLPTFFLESQVQGIVSLEHAAQIAWDMVESINNQCGVCLTLCDDHGRTFTKTASN